MTVDLKLIRAVGENLPLAMRGEADIMEAMMQDNTLRDFYDGALAMEAYAKDVARIVAQLTHRFPHMNILELGKLIYTGPVLEPF